MGMTNKEAQKVLDEMQDVRPEKLNTEAKRLFEAIMTIADERDTYKQELEQKEAEISALEQEHNYDVKMIDNVKGEAVKLYKIVDAMAKMINKHDIDEDICSQFGKDKDCLDYDNEEHCIYCIKKYFRKKVEEEDNQK